MHKQLKFFPQLIDPILQSKKTVTWRLWDEKDLTKDDIVDFLEYGTNKHFATAQLMHITEKPLGLLTKKDKIGHEPFSTDAEMYRTFSTYYNRPVDKETLVKLIHFKILAKHD